MKKAFISSLCLLGLSSLPACQFYARSPEEYSKETSKLLETKEDELKACYDELLEKDATLQGVVAVDFTVEAKTGLIKNPVVNKEKTTAPEPLQKCVLDVMDDLKLDPADQREGKASWAYNFTLGEPKG